MAERKDGQNFVVIGRDATYAGADRTWMSTEEEAIEHARRLLIDNGSRPGAEVFVVRAVAKVRVDKPQPPITITHLA